MLLLTTSNAAKVPWRVQRGLCRIVDHPVSPATGTADGSAAAVLAAAIHGSPVSVAAAAAGALAAFCDTLRQLSAAACSIATARQLDGSVHVGAADQAACSGPGALASSVAWSPLLSSELLQCSVPDMPEEDLCRLLQRKDCSIKG